MAVPLSRDFAGNFVYNDQFHYLQLIGFILLALGILLFNEIIVLPFFKLNEFTKSAL